MHLLPSIDPSHNEVPTPIAPEHVVAVINDALHPSRFRLAGPFSLDWTPVITETLRWEVYRGRLLPPEMTRQQRTLRCWQIYSMDSDGRSGVPILAIHWDTEENVLYVVRGLHCYAWEAYDSGSNVIESRESRKWLRELVGTLRLGEFRNADALRDELTWRLFQAVVGTSRLPLTSMEAPLPAFSFGQLLYLRGPSITPLEKIKLFETWLRSRTADEMPQAATDFMALWRQMDNAETDLPALFRGLFQEISLSPYTDFIDKFLCLVRCLENEELLSAQETADFLTYLLRLSGRHLTAYDLVTFHNQGANYPDALLVDAVLKELTTHVSSHPDLYFGGPGDSPDGNQQKRFRRRGLRHGILTRRRYQGLRVPDMPTSQGENIRVLPASHPRVPPEQITQPPSRTRQLFQDEALREESEGPTGKLFRQALDDLHHPHELRELGMAIFLDRPLGVLKDPLETDQTPLLSYEAFSRTIAERRLREMTDSYGWLERPTHEKLLEALHALPVTGVPLASIPSLNRPAPVSLDDARKVADDFLFLRTTRSSVAQFMQLFDLEPMRRRFQLDFLDRPIVILRDAVGIAIYDDSAQKRVELALLADNGYRCRAGIEYPADGLQVLRVWHADQAGGRLTT